MIKPEDIEDMLFSSVIMADARRIAALDEEKLIRILNSDIMNASPFSNSENHEIMENLKKTLWLMIFMSRELRSIIPGIDKIKDQTEDMIASLPNAGEIRKKIDVFMNDVSKLTKDL